MIEVFKTDISYRADADKMVQQLQGYLSRRKN
jgi:hypothetical protein